jgi:Zn finger protein HypA/HybF involved in hydrogenase expression
MTRLIDADALVAYFERLEGDTIAVTDAAAVADNAPTVHCGACKHYAPWHKANVGECACGHMEAEHMPRPTFGCVDFERRQP